MRNVDSLSLARAGARVDTFITITNRSLHASLNASIVLQACFRYFRQLFQIAMHRSNTTRRLSNPLVVIDYPWTKTKEDVAAFYTVDEMKGLSDERVKRDLERYGPNGVYTTRVETVGKA